MQHKHLQLVHSFRVVLGDGHSQPAQLPLGPGQTEGGPDNRRQGADQWIYVASSTGEVLDEGRRIDLRAGTLILIQRGEKHEIRNTGAGPLRTLNVYVPPTYTEEGDELPPVRA
jgi:mannose-6-phosphate isomerase-like protein (cupin superfamily)